MRKNLIITLVILLLIVVGISDVAAQCPMCRLSASTNLESGGTAGRGLNNGIMFMLSLPYIGFGLLAFLWYRNRKEYDDMTE